MSAYNYSEEASVDDGSCRVCGDSNIDDGDAETCDDGNTENGDGCNEFCQVEYCGDGVTQQ
ncbi:MAG: hypothetical protein H6765_09450 [Candidatus Peribacteria bacterium]|nr:MAG: hypothetical protein H6765_09450 [Candidatus Peribacteria bacterium]